MAGLEAAVRGQARTLTSHRVRAPVPGGREELTPAPAAGTIAGMAAGGVIGREPELGLVSAFLGRPGDGPAGLVIEGEPGIGKSTLWRTAVEAARERGLLVVSSRPAEAERDLAHVGLGDLFEDALAQVAPLLSTPRRRAASSRLPPTSFSTPRM